jgi:hypothetical protein
MATREQRMADVIIENPILNGPFREPERHFRFGDEGITNEIVPGRRSSSYFIPIARPKKKGKQLAFETEWTQDRIEDNKTRGTPRRPSAAASKRQQRWWHDQLESARPSRLLSGPPRPPGERGQG